MFKQAIQVSHHDHPTNFSEVSRPHHSRARLAHAREEMFRLVQAHTTQKGEGYNVDYGVRSKPFQIPFRSCQSRDVDNLYMAGRCISGGFLPMSSYRVTGSAVEMGENVAIRVCEIISNK
ncbi:MAG: FAD-dependent oxidoreductase [Bacteroidales bacterium]|nr:FAD-dependent oxidoreductase [Bacteroidales bacterium]